MSWIKIAPLALMLCACTQVEPSRVNEQPLRTARESSEILLVNDGDIQRAADQWQRSGQSPIRVVATYGVGDKDAAERNAKTAANRLKALGVSEVFTETMPARNTEVIAHMIVLKAGADSSCSRIPGVSRLQTGYDFHYRLGCSVDDFMGKQVASTPDLEGRVAGQQGYRLASDAQRAGNVVDVYRKGEVNEPLKGLVSSDIAERD